VSLYEREVEENYKQFDKSSFEAATATRETLAASSTQYLASYRLVTTLQAWRSVVLEGLLDDDALAFFLEAQNDALASHALARVGMWRSALQSLRSCIENVLTCTYYMDHPVELRLWSIAGHRLNFSDLLTYFERHPDLVELPQVANGLSILSKEFATLSRAVHGSAARFRMSAAGKPELWNAEPTKLGAWATRQRKAITAINVFLLALFREQLSGTKKAPLRQAVGAIFSKAKAEELRKHLKVTLE
jgi:hypothetical protein